MQHISLGQAAIQPADPVVAGSFVTLTFTYTAGHPVDDSGYLKIVFRHMADFGTPQFHDPAAPNYCTVSTSGNCRIEPRWDPKGHTRPWSRALYFKVRGGFLDRGEQIAVTFGDTRGGSPGWQMQTFCEHSFEFKTLIDPIATCEFKELPHSPTLRVAPGAPVRAVCIAPSRVTVGQPFDYHLKLEDRWGNPISSPVALSHPGFARPGVQTLVAGHAETGLSAESNPIEVTAARQPLQPYWADFHGQSEETIGSNSIEDYFAFARDDGRLDIAAHQGNDFQVTDLFWHRVNQVSRDFYQPGVFVTFPGYEWSGNTPLGGDRNVYFAAEGGQMVHSSVDLLPDKSSAYPVAGTASALFEALRVQDGPTPFVFAHVGGRYADLAVHDPALELAVEVHSAWGTFEWLVEEALERGYRVGICANSDGHKGRPGASFPGASVFGSLGGLTCVLARQLDRQSVLQALQARHFYATTGHRGLLQVRLEPGDGRSAVMGDVVAIGSDTPHLHVWAVGTAAIESIQVRNGLEPLATLRPYGSADLGRRVKIVWSGAEVRGRDRMVAWDGRLRLRGNTILEAAPIHFWNADRPLRKTGPDQLAWQSVTTGGLAGVVLTLADARAGELEIETLQGCVTCAVDTLGLEPQSWPFGGLRKQIAAYRLPEPPTPREFSFTWPLTSLRPGDNPIYVRVMQEDGHMAWSSPVYVVRSA
ncbi:MAG: DUF3604 domain-containing protein [Chloroflexota bacterium]